LLGDALEPRDGALNLVGDVRHLASSGASGEDVGPSSFAWFTPSARAM
jgi:hypothetical protein